MNLLEQFLATQKINETEAMNYLQDHGIVSDNCVWAKDVADVDCERACKVLVSSFNKTH